MTFTTPFSDRLSFTVKGNKPTGALNWLFFAWPHLMHFLTFGLNWNENRVFRSPSKRKAIENISRWHASFDGPCGNVLGSTSEGEHSIATAIIALLYRKCPMTIIRAIISGIIAPFNRMLLRWLGVHIGNEIVNITPSFTNLNSSTAVTRVRGVRRVIASLQHQIPGIVQRMIPLSVCRIFTNTATTFYTPALQRLTGSIRQRSADTPTNPSMSITTYSDIAQYGQIINTTSGTIYKFTARWKWLKRGANRVFNHKGLDSILNTYIVTLSEVFA